MKVVWSRGDATVRDVYEALLEQRKMAYTTVMTMMNVLERKGHLRKKVEGRSFLYRPTRPQRKVVGSMVREFVERVFGGSAAPSPRPPRRGGAAHPRGARRPREAHPGEAVSALELVLRNLAAWSVQVAVLGLAAAFLSRLVPIERPAARLAFGQAPARPRARPAAPPAVAGRRLRGELALRPRAVSSCRHTRGRRLRSGLVGAPLLERRSRRRASPRRGAAAGPGRRRARRLRALRLGARPVLAPAWLLALRDEDSAAGGRFVRCEETGAPATFGVRRPVVLLPPAFESMSRDRQEAVALHELVHARRADWLALVAEEILKAVIFFHPVVHWLVERVRLAREQTVDAEVVRRLGAREAYLDSLVEVARLAFRSRAVPAAPFLRESHLRERVDLLLKEVPMSRVRTLAHLALTATAVVLVVVLGGLRRATAGGGRPPRRSRSRTTSRPRPSRSSSTRSTLPTRPTRRRKASRASFWST